MEGSNCGFRGAGHRLCLQEFYLLHAVLVPLNIISHDSPSYPRGRPHLSQFSEKQPYEAFRGLSWVANLRSGALLWISVRVKVGRNHT